MNNKKTLFMSLVIVLLVGLMISAGTFAYFQWTTDINQRTNVNVTIEAGGIKMIMTPEGGILEAKGLKPVADCMESYAYFDTKIQIQNTTGSLVVPSFKLSARVKPNSAANAGTLKKSDLSHIHYTVVEIFRNEQEIMDNKADDTGARRCYEPSHIQKDGVGRNGLFTETSNDGTVATGTFADMEATLTDGWTSAINLPSEDGVYLARQYNDDPVKGDLGTYGITFMGDIADSTGMRLTNRYFRVYVWIDAGYTYTNAGENMADPMNNAIIEVTWSEDSIVQQVTGSVNRQPGLYELNGDFTSWEQFVKNDFVGIDDSNDYLASISHYDLTGNLLSGDLIIPEGILGIGIQVFMGSDFRRIYMPSSVTVIDERAFIGTNIEEVVFAQGSQLTTIGDLAFYDSRIKNIVIPSGVTTIGSEAFAWSALESVYIPSSVTSIGYYSFDGLAFLDKITYEGTVSEWNELIRANGMGDIFGNTVLDIYVECSDGQIYPLGIPD